MTTINIDIKKVQSANYDLPPTISNLSIQKKYIRMLKQQIPAEIQNRRYIRERLDAALRELDRAGQQLDSIYRVTESAVEQYMDMETRLTANASKFQ